MGKISNAHLALAVGSIGMLLLAFGLVEFLYVAEIGTSLTLAIVGYILMIHYLYLLEKNVGISAKWAWIRAVVFVVIITGYTYTNY